MPPDGHDTLASRTDRRMATETISAFLARRYRSLRDCSNTLVRICLTVGTRHHVSPWVDFNFENLMGAYGDILSKPVTAFNGLQTARFDLMQLDDLKDFAVDYMFSRLREPLSIGVSEVWTRLVPDMSSFQPQLSLRPRSGDDPLTSYLAVSYFDPRLATRINIAVGCAKLARQWHSGALSTNMDIAFHPINQGIDYCQAAHTRYGFILTNEELVVIRVTYNAMGATKIPHAQYKAIPWPTSGEGVLTAHLALWCLVMMSMNDEHRPIGNFGMVMPLSAWWRVPDSNIELYRHHLSNRERSSLPPGAQYRWEPPQGE
ncbi:hypothetical protein FDECE_5111 [Fusarium decemcellulare]|nr:hypothetical protein FDECE_5111 [Fusarium decemcellulare]